MPTTSGRPRRRRANGDVSREKILIAATEIAAERGYDGTSISLVSARSDLPASSIYWHFKDKDALLAAVIERSFGLWLTGVGRVTPHPEVESPEVRLPAMMQRTVDSLRESSDFLRLGLMLALERREEEPSARKMFLSVRREALRRTVASYAELFSGLDDAATRQLAVFTMAMADGLFISREIDGDDEDPAGDADLLAAGIGAAAKHLSSPRAAVPGSPRESDVSATARPD